MSIYNYLAKKSNGDIVSMQTYKGQVMLIVNTASKCDFTYQYEDLQRIYQKYNDKGFTVLGFPSNQFANQNPENGADTARACQLSYGVQFPMYDVVQVNGEATHPLYNYLKHEVDPRPVDSTNIQEAILMNTIKDNYPDYLLGNNIRWNFTKFLVDASGNVIKRFEPSDSILDIESLIEELLPSVKS